MDVLIFNEDLKQLLFDHPLFKDYINYIEKNNPELLQPYYQELVNGNWDLVCRLIMYIYGERMFHFIDSIELKEDQVNKLSWSLWPDETDPTTKTTTNQSSSSRKVVATLEFYISSCFAFDRFHINQNKPIILYEYCINDDDGHQQLSSQTNIVDCLQVVDIMEKYYPSNKESYNLFRDDIINNLVNIPLSYVYTRPKMEAIKQEAGILNCHSIPEFIEKKVALGQGLDVQVFYEQFHVRGSPTHIMHKIKRGFDCRQAIQYSPEFSNPFPSRMVAIHKSIGSCTKHIDAMDSNDYLFKHFPLESEQLKLFFSQEMNLSLESYYINFVHPFQLDDSIPTKFKKEIDSREIIIIPAAITSKILFNALISLRSVNISDLEKVNHSYPSLKMSVGVCLTNKIRNMPPECLHYGTQFSKTLDSIFELEKDNGFGTKYECVRELFGIYYNRPCDDDNLSNDPIEKEKRTLMSTIVREDMTKYIEEGDHLVCIPALFNRSPLSNNILLIEFVQQFQQQSSSSSPLNLREAIIEWYKIYFNMVIPFYLTMFTKHGIALECHHQNTYVVIRRGVPIKIIFKDWECPRFNVERFSNYEEYMGQGHRNDKKLSYFLKKISILIFHSSEFSISLLKESKRMFPDNPITEDILSREAFNIAKSTLDKFKLVNPQLAKNVEQDEQYLFGNPTLETFSITKWRLNVNSAIWLGQLYGLTMTNETDICNKFTCQVIGSERHIIKIGQYPECVSIYIYGDTMITQVPEHFNQAFPNLINLLFCSKLIDFAIPPSPSLVNLLLSISYQSNYTHRFTQQLFPKLEYIISQNHGVTIQVASPLIFAFNSGPGSINPIFSYPESIKHLLISDTNPSYSFPRDFGLFPNLKALYLPDSTGPFPITAPLPSKLGSLSYFDSNLTGTVPSNFLSNNPQLSWLDLEDNQLLQGSFGEESCYLERLDIRNTSISSVPDCWWCYYDYTINHYLRTDLTKPSTINCPEPQLDTNSTNVISANQRVTVTGRNIGWGYGLDLTVIDANRKLYADLKSMNIHIPLGETQNVTIQFSAKWNRTVTVRNIEFSVLNVTMDLKTNQEVIVYYQYAVSNYLPNVTVRNGYIESLKSVDTNNCTTGCRAVYTIPNTFNIDEMIKVVISTSVQSQTIRSSLIIIKDTIVTSVNLQSSTLNLFGYFGIYYNENGEPQPVIGSVLINNTINCIIATTTTPTPTFINCTLDQLPTSGPATISVSVRNGNYSSSSLLFIPYPQPSNNDCKDRTKNCNGHGTCVNGQCQCDQGWVDDCRLKNEKDPEVIFKPNITSPTSSSFSYNDFIFSFDMIEIQELDIDGNIVKRLESNSWLLNDKSTNDLVSLSYDLVSHQNDSEYSLLNVTSIVEFSNSSRTIQFGDDLIQLGAGSIKISVNITNWPFTSVLSNLRVLFSTTINNEQSIVGCDDSVNTIESFQQSSNDDSIQYLRVVKDNVQFFGRFIDYCLSDGRKTYSKTQLINTTVIDQDNSIALIGISLPQSQISILDPDFSALVINPDNYGKCSSESDNKWKMIVGVVVGVVGAVCVSVIIFVIVKRIRHHMILNSKSIKMDTINQRT
ncbi:hypothetical protein DFA_12326 [Cavenderia fasciculata]|uniref:EGF-like domain-containing protein n=1 Tax=Cavenderia fasciculata TaxID=261658 RepID=F4QD79_CACFS|nr:uncharacterized protein DFA_12326 [Cavenderia fasciculata]EGG14550.1 hypothetical protein DFA_12326 [Cavenderia fasciculata]|eukprot:XP_004366070.1 hypothetical protein DFA_12326 [Cavenderia fasciculata]